MKKHKLKPPAFSKKAPVNRQKEQPHPNLPSLDEFEKALLPELNEIHECLRATFVLRAYELVQRKMALEQLRKNLIADRSTVHDAIKVRRMILTQVRRAISAIDSAQQKSEVEHPALLRGTAIMEARKLLTSAQTELAWLAEKVLPGFIHPELGNSGAKASSSMWPLHKRYTVGFGLAKIDHWFIGELDQLFESICLTKALQTVKVGRDRIIKAIFQIAFNYSCQIERIKTARLQKSRERRVK